MRQPDGLSFAEAQAHSQRAVGEQNGDLCDRPCASLAGATRPEPHGASRPSGKLAILAVCAGHTFDTVERKRGITEATSSMRPAGELAAALGLDMAAYW